MSNLFKSKFLFGVMIVAVMFVGGLVAFSNDAAAADCSITTTLRAGSVGAEVSCLQSIIGVSADGKFGPMTKAAVMAWQASKGLVADGVVGAMTRAALMGAPTGNFPAGCTSASGYSSTTGVKCDTGASAGLPAGCSSTAGYSPLTGAKCDGGSTPSTSGPVSGGAGSITVDAKATYSNEDVIAGDEDAKVLAFEVEADDESDVEITSVKVELKQTVGTNSDDITDYIDSVSVWMGGEKVGEADASDFSENSNIYTKAISLDDAIVRAGETETFVVAVTALSNLDSGDINDDSFGVDVLNVRFEDGEGVVTTEDTDDSALDRTFDFDDLATSGDLELKLTEASGNPDAQVVEVDDVSETDVTMLKFNLKASGSDMNIDSMEFNTLALGVDLLFTDMVSQISLMNGSEEIDSVSAALVAQAAGVDTVLGTADDVAGTIQFTDLDLTIAEGDTEAFSIVAQVRDILTTAGSATDFDQGDSLAVSFLGTGNLDDTTNTDVEDENGDNVAAGDRTGSVAGEAQTFNTDGISVTLDSVDADAFTVDGVTNDRVELMIKFKVTAFGTDAFIPSAIDASNSTVGTASTGTAPTVNDGVAFHVQSADAQLADASLTATTLTSTAEEMTNSFKVLEGDTETFTLNVVVTNAGGAVLSGSSFRALLAGVNFANTDAAVGDFVYTSDLTDTFKTPYAVIAD
jgi:peptidoglycan hydrolase-like protein with peptidoglycan-binding domain